MFFVKIFTKITRLFNKAMICKTKKGNSFSNVIHTRIYVWNTTGRIRLLEALKWNHDNGLDTEEKRKDYVFKTPFMFKEI